VYEEKLSEMRGKSLLRTVCDRQNPQGRIIVIGGRGLVNFSSNDYLGLASNEEIKEAARVALEKYGVGGGASRLLSGGCEIHAALEDEIARFKGTQGAVLFNSGYAANIGAIPALAPEGSLIFSDELNHASIIDGCRLSRAEVLKYRHNDPDHLEKLLITSGSGCATPRVSGDAIPRVNGGAISGVNGGATTCRSGRATSRIYLDAASGIDVRAAAGADCRAVPRVIGRKVIITESVFSMDGDIALLPEIYALAKRHGAVLYVDEAHATGVMGAGRGALARFGIGADPDVIQMGTLSKAAGSVGGFIAGSEEVIDYLVNTARSLIYSTALPPADAAASLAAMRMIAGRPELILKLTRNAKKCRRLLSRAGFKISTSPLDITPIIPVVFGTVRQTVKAAAFLLERGIYAPAIRPPTVKTPRIRVTVTAAHTDEDIKLLADVLKEAGRAGESKGCKRR
jgi:7-keto-8-aminopelargonate synthetase-like enzyme